MALSSSFWKKYFKEYDLLNLLIPYQETIKAIIESLELKVGDRVLDAGSGTGNISIALSKIGAKVTSFDSTEEGLKRHREKDDKADTLLGDLTKPLPFDDSYFDAVCTNNVIYTIQGFRREKIFNEFFRILKPGGRIVVSDIAVGFSPLKIYLRHITGNINRVGLVGTLREVIKLLVPTCKIFYYNYLIKKENSAGNYGFIKKGEHEKLLSDSGFINISSDRKVYADQALLSRANK